MEVHSDNLTILLLWSVCCFLVMRAPMEVRGDAITPETCSTQTSTPCLAMVGYVPSVNIGLSHIASLFSLNYTSLLGPNDLDPSLQDLLTLVVPENKVYSIPQTCGCVDFKRTVTSTNYTVVSGDTMSTIADAYYSHLVTYQQIAAVNGISNPDNIDPGQEFMIPIPCACFNQSDGTRPGLFLSYQIQTGDTLSAIANTYNTSVAYLRELNSIFNDSFKAADVLFVPRPVCKANFSSGVEDGNLTVVEGTYELTANGCVQCSCNNGTLHCIQAHSSLGTTCSNLTCENSSLALGTSTASQENQGCSVQSCVYKGYSAKSGIVSRLETEEDPTCPSALPPETFYKPPTGLVASPLGLPATQATASSPPPLSTPAANPPSSTTTPNSATRLVGFVSCWWCLLAVLLLL